MRIAELTHIQRWIIEGRAGFVECWENAHLSLYFYLTDSAGKTTYWDRTFTSHFLAEARTRIFSWRCGWSSGHDWVDRGYSSPDSGVMDFECRKCGRSGGYQVLY